MTAFRDLVSLLRGIAGRRRSPGQGPAAAAGTPHIHVEGGRDEAASPRDGAWIDLARVGRDPEYRSWACTYLNDLHKAAAVARATIPRPSAGSSASRDWSATKAG